MPSAKCQEEQFILLVPPTNLDTWADRRIDGRRVHGNTARYITRVMMSFVKLAPISSFLEDSANSIIWDIQATYRSSVSTAESADIESVSTLKCSKVFNLGTSVWWFKFYFHPLAM